jgi:DNA-binding MarR family transcriptional regulator
MNEIIQCCQGRMLFESHKFGLPQAELKCLMLFDMERYLTVKGIAQKMEVAKSRVTKIMDGLTRKRLIQSTEDPNDGRVKLLSLTPAGQDKLKEIGTFTREIHQKILHQIESEQRRTVLSSLELLRSSMEAVKAQLK